MTWTGRTSLLTGLLSIILLSSSLANAGVLGSATELTQTAHLPQIAYPSQWVSYDNTSDAAWISAGVATSTLYSVTMSTVFSSPSTSVMTYSPVFASPGDSTTLIVPLFGHPTADWDLLAQEKLTNPGVPVVAVINPNSGPGGVADPIIANGVQTLRTAGITVIGYVFTNYTARPLAAVEADILRYAHFYRTAGVYLDQMSNLHGNEWYYSTLTQYAHSVGMTLVIGNPGADVPSSYVGIVDSMIIYESSGLPTLSFLGGWHSSYSKSNFGMSAYNVTTLSPAFISNASKSLGYVYVTDGKMPDPYLHLPTYISPLIGEIPISSPGPTCGNLADGAAASTLMGGYVYVTGWFYNNCISVAQVRTSDGTVLNHWTFTNAYRSPADARGIVNDGTSLFVCAQNSILKLTTAGVFSPVATLSGDCTGLAISGSTLFFTESNSHGAGRVNTDGTGFFEYSCLCQGTLEPLLVRGSLYATDGYDHTVLKFSSGGLSNTYAYPTTTEDGPFGMVYDSQSNALWVSGFEMLNVCPLYLGTKSWGSCVAVADKPLTGFADAGNNVWNLPLNSASLLEIRNGAAKHAFATNTAASILTLTQANFAVATVTSTITTQTVYAVATARLPRR